MFSDCGVTNRYYSIGGSGKQRAGLWHYIPMLFESDKIMFEIYRETEYTGRYRVVYFTELQEHNKEAEINRALTGEHFYDGFVLDHRKVEGRKVLDEMVRKLNRGESVTPQDIERELSDLGAAG